MITPTARSTTLPLLMNSLNSWTMLIVGVRTDVGFAVIAPSVLAEFAARSKAPRETICGPAPSGYGLPPP